MDTDAKRKLIEKILNGEITKDEALEIEMSDHVAVFFCDKPDHGEVTEDTKGMLQINKEDPQPSTYGYYKSLKGHFRTAVAFCDYSKKDIGAAV